MTSRWLLALAIATALSGCAGGDPTPGTPVHLGPSCSASTALSGTRALPMIREGQLPDLARLMDRGGYGWLLTFVPTKSPVIWTSIATGEVSKKHGTQNSISRAAEAPSRDLTLVYFGGPGVVGHRCWRSMVPHRYTDRPRLERGPPASAVGGDGRHPRPARLRRWPQSPGLRSTPKRAAGAAPQAGLHLGVTPRRPLESTGRGG